MNPTTVAMRRPLTLMVLLTSVILAAGFALWNMPVDIFPDLKVPVIYVAQPYGGMDPGQMEAYLTYYFEYHFLYITGIHHVESKNIQGVALMKLFFHPGTNMAQAMAETVAYVNRSRSFMPEGTVPPFIMRFDAGSVPVGFLVFSSDNPNRTIGEIQDAALNRVRPQFASLPGVSAPPPFGGNQRTVLINVKPDRLRSYGMSPDEVVKAVAEDNRITPTGNVVIDGRAPMVPVNSIVTNPSELENVAIRKDSQPTVFVRDVADVVIGTDIPTGYGLVNGKRSVYILVTKRADASVLDVVKTVKANLPRLQAAIPPELSDVKVKFEFDQSPYVTRAMWGVTLEGAIGAVLTGLMVLLFLFDWRSVIVVVLNIPLAILGAVVALWLTGQTINIMTLGGLALAIGILVDESTVMVENIHAQMGKTGSIARAVRLANTETAIPRLLAMLCVLAVFIPSFFMQGAARALFVPLALAVGFSMMGSYLLSSTFVPVLSTWLLRHRHTLAPTGREGSVRGRPGFFSFSHVQDGYARLLRGVVAVRWILAPTYLVVAVLVIVLVGGRLGLEIFPAVDAGQFQLRLRAPEGTPLERTEQLAKNVLDAISNDVGADKVDMTVSLVGTASYNYPINAIYLWTAGPQEAVLKVSLKRGSGVRIEKLKEKLRRSLPGLDGMEGVKLTFEAGDIVEEVMSFGAPTRVEVDVSGTNLDNNRAYADKIHEKLAGIPCLCDLQITQGLAYPTIKVEVDRQRAGLSGVSAADVGRALAPTTLSSRFTQPIYWRDPKIGIAYQVQVQVLPQQLQSVDDLKTMTVKRTGGKEVLVRDVAELNEDKAPGEYDRYNMRRLVSVAANIQGQDLGRVSRLVDQALKEAEQELRTEYGDKYSEKFLGTQVDVRGQVVPMRQMFGALAGGRWYEGLTAGLVVAVLVILLLLTANFESLKMSLIVVSTVPAVLVGVIVALLVTGTTLNIQSFMGSIMAVGVAVANAILLATFAERSRREGAEATVAAVEGARYRLRPILMTSFAMIAGMMAMAVGFGEGGEQTAPLGRAVVGGLAAATLATLFVLPSVFALVQGRAARRSASLDPDDPASRHYERVMTALPADGPASPPSAQGEIR
jgi:multidrug efflux pump subunit AcrB